MPAPHHNLNLDLNVPQRTIEPLRLGDTLTEKRRNPAQFVANGVC
jgi:hypothetical protein